MKRYPSTLLVMLALLLATAGLAAPCQGKHCGGQHHRGQPAAHCGERCGPCASGDAACAEACAARRAACREACAGPDGETRGCAEFRARQGEGREDKPGAPDEVPDAGRR